MVSINIISHKYICIIGNIITQITTFSLSDIGKDSYIDGFYSCLSDVLSVLDQEDPHQAEVRSKLTAFMADVLERKSSSQTDVPHAPQVSPQGTLPQKIPQGPQSITLPHGYGLPGSPQGPALHILAPHGNYHHPNWPPQGYWPPHGISSPKPSPPLVQDRSPESRSHESRLPHMETATPFNSPRRHIPTMPIAPVAVHALSREYQTMSQLSAEQASTLMSQVQVSLSLGQRSVSPGDCSPDRRADEPQSPISDGRDTPIDTCIGTSDRDTLIINPKWDTPTASPNKDYPEIQDREIPTRDTPNTSPFKTPDTPRKSGKSIGVTPFNTPVKCDNNNIMTPYVIQKDGLTPFHTPTGIRDEQPDTEQVSGVVHSDKYPDACGKTEKTQNTAASRLKTEATEESANNKKGIKRKRKQPRKVKAKVSASINDTDTTSTTNLQEKTSQESMIRQETSIVIPENSIVTSTGGTKCTKSVAKRCPATASAAEALLALSSQLPLVNPRTIKAVDVTGSPDRPNTPVYTQL